MRHLLPRLGALLLLALSAVSCSTLSSGPARPGLRQYDWVSHDGKVMPWQAWRTPEGMPVRAVVIAVHGLSGASSDFWFLGDKLPAHGFAVYAYDIRGQGKDPAEAERGDIKSSREWRRDLEVFDSLVRRRHPGRPVFWYGESLGSLICLHTAGEHLFDLNDPDGVILASPVAGLRVTVSGFKRFLLETAAKLAPRTRFSLGELAGVDEKKIQVTSGTTHGGQMEETGHHVHSFTLRLLTEIGGLLDKNAEAARHLHMPVLFLASPNDVLSSADQVQTLFGQVRSSKKRLLWYSRSYHLLLHDVQKEEVVKDVVAWLESRIYKAPRPRALALLPARPPAASPDPGAAAPPPQVESPAAPAATSESVPAAPAAAAEADDLPPAKS